MDTSVAGSIPAPVWDVSPFYILKDFQEKGCHRFFDPFNKVTVDVVSERDIFFHHKDLDMIIASGLLKNRVEVIDLKDHERALVWIDERLDRLLEPGLYAI